METLAEKLKKTSETPYQKIARDFNTSLTYVGKIARGERIPQRGKGLKIKLKIEELTQKQTL